MSGNVCRCGTYGAIRRAIHRAADLQAGDSGTDDPPVPTLVTDSGAAGGDR
jgi:xanthine dehydrogenase iron-sulfur cluster and FAD-binding subunit A